MPNCPKCGNEVSEEMAFCPKCGTSLKGEQPTGKGKLGEEYGWRMAQRERDRARRRTERMARREEKYETSEKGELHELAFVGPVIGGLILIFLGFLLYLQVTGALNFEILGALFFVVIGIIIIAAAVYAATVQRRRHPAP